MIFFASQAGVRSCLLSSSWIILPMCISSILFVRKFREHNISTNNNRLRQKIRDNFSRKREDLSQNGQSGFHISPKILTFVRKQTLTQQ